MIQSTVNMLRPDQVESALNSTWAQAYMKVATQLGEATGVSGDEKVLWGIGDGFQFQDTNHVIVCPESFLAYVKWLVNEQGQKKLTPILRKMEKLLE